MTLPSTQQQQQQIPTGAQPVNLGPFKGGMNNAGGTGDFIQDTEVLSLVNLEVDTDGSLVNRPAINELTYTIAGAKDGVHVLGSYLPNDGRHFLVVMTNGSVKLIDLATATSVATSNTGLSNASVVQYDNKLWVVPGPTDTAGNGGFFDVPAPTTTSWTTTAAIPRGGSVLLYKERLWIVAGIDSSTNTSRLQFSALGIGTSWPGANFLDVGAGNGEKLVFGLVLNNDVILFKQHSTYRFTYDTDPAKAVLSQVSNNIGVPQPNCAVTYDNNNIYVMHDDSVYEFFNYTFTRISDRVSMLQDSDLTLYSGDIYGLSLYRDRLFVRYYANLYVYSLRTDTWSRCVTVRKFSRLTVIPSTTVGLDIAYTHAATTDQAGKIFYFRDSRIQDVGTTTGETFDCSITSKTYDFGLPFAFKRLFRWGASLATSGNATADAYIPNISDLPTWADDEIGDGIWDDVLGDIWGTADSVVHETIVAPDKGEYARKYYRLNGAYRFVRTYFMLTTTVAPNDVADSAVKIFSLMVFLKQGEKVNERVN